MRGVAEPADLSVPDHQMVMTDVAIQAPTRAAS